MNILIINHYAGSPRYGMEFRPYYLAREWVKQGHSVTIIGASFSHLRLLNPMVKNDFQDEIIDGVRFVWLKTPKYNSSLSRIWNIFSFVWKLSTHVKKIARLYRPNLVIASSTYPIDNIPAHKIACLAGAKYTYEVHDLWPLSPMLIGGYSKNHPFIQVMQWGENYAYRHVDKVISLLWNSEDHMRKHGLPSGKFVCIPNGFDPSEWTNKAFEQVLPSAHMETFNKLQGKIIVGFAGGFAASGALMTFVKAANCLKNRDDLAFVLVGRGPEEDHLREYVSAHDLQNVSFLPAIPKKMIPTLLHHFDIAYMGGIHSLLHRYGTSYNKLTDYLLSAKPIIQALDEPGSIVERLNCGIRVEAENSKLVVEAIESLTALSAAEREAIGLRGRDYALMHLPWSNLADHFLTSFKE